MSYNEKHASHERSPKHRQEDNLSDVTDRGTLSSVDRELDRLFAGFWENPARARQRRLQQQGSPRHGKKIIDDDSTETYSAE